MSLSLSLSLSLYIYMYFYICQEPNGLFTHAFFPLRYGLKPCRGASRRLGIKSINSVAKDNTLHDACKFLDLHE